jgi:hypothetical protein
MYIKSIEYNNYTSSSWTSESDSLSRAGFVRFRKQQLWPFFLPTTAAASSSAPFVVIFKKTSSRAVSMR